MKFILQTVTNMKKQNPRNKNNRRHAVLRTGLAAVVCLLLLFSLTACSGNAKLANGDFERGSGSDIEDWQQYDYQRDYLKNTECTTISLVDIGFSGQCVRIENREKNDARIYQELKVKPDSKYQIQLDVLYENVSADKQENGAAGDAGLNISVIGGSGRTAGLYGTVEVWQTITAYFTTGDQKTAELSIGLGGYQGDTSGTVYIDNVRIEKVDTIPDNASVFSAELPSSGEKKVSSAYGTWMKVLFLVLTGSLIAFVIFVAIKADKENAARHNPLSQKNPILNWKDFTILLVMVTVCTAMSFFKLGSTNVPSSYWKAADANESIIVEFEKAETLSRIVYSNNIPVGDEKTHYYEVYYEKQADPEAPEEEAGADPYVRLFGIGSGSFFAWDHKDYTVKTQRVKIVSLRGGLAINEMGFFTKNDAGEYEKLTFEIVETSYDAGKNSLHHPVMLFDEQETVEPYSSYMNSTYFDEIYFPRTAYEQLNGESIYEVTHPPMGKVLMSLGIRLFGMNPFGWRFMGTLFGVAIIPLMYLLGLKIFKKRVYAFAAAFLMLFDFMRLTQTRLATIDSYSAFFILCMYYFMYDYFTQKSYEKKPFWKSLIPLFFCGIMFGLGAATKWICLYTGVGLAFLFFLAKYLEADDFASGRAASVNPKKSWLVYNFLPTCGACVIFFLVIPGLIYTLSYIPYLASSDQGLLDIVLDNQEYMFHYHAGLTSDHPYGSEWYTWPVNLRPIFYYSGSNANLPAGISTSIVAMGNPLVWWTGLACIFPAIFYTWKRRDKGMLVVLVGYAAQFFPWILVTRVVFIYHYFTAVPFLIFMIVYVIRNLIEDGVISRSVLWIYLGLVLLLFIMFYPVLTGRQVSRDYIETFLRWFSTWSF